VPNQLIENADAVRPDDELVVIRAEVVRDPAREPSSNFIVPIECFTGLKPGLSPDTRPSSRRLTP
jgi:hypothetical protein